MSNLDPNLEKYKDELITVLHKSQDTFETQLSYISAGALGLSMAFIKDIVKFNEASYKGLVICGWVFLALTLLVNFISHNISASYLSKAIEEINTHKYSASNVTRRSNVINLINRFTIGTLVLGIAFIIIYVSINIRP